MTPAEVLRSAAQYLHFRVRQDFGVLHAMAAAGKDEPQATADAFLYLHQIIGDELANEYQKKHGVERMIAALQDAARLATS